LEAVNRVYETLFMGHATFLLGIQTGENLVKKAASQLNTFSFQKSASQMGSAQCSSEQLNSCLFYLQKQ
jgi:hypothetical protein